MQTLLNFFLESFTISFILASYIGPVSIFLIKRTIERGFIAGIIVSFGASLGDLSYVLAVSMGLIYTPDNIVHIIKIIGSIVVITIGVVELYNSKKSVIQTAENINTTIKYNNWELYCKSFLIAYTIVVAHPMSFVIFISVVSSIAGMNFEICDAIAIALGMFSGGIILRFMLTSLIFKTRHLISNKLFSRVRAVAAVLLMGFGGYTLYEAII
jgi:threonine/homoserine/homoserine lactone efflux protein